MKYRSFFILLSVLASCKTTSQGGAPKSAEDVFKEQSWREFLREPGHKLELTFHQEMDRENDKIVMVDGVIDDIEGKLSDSRFEAKNLKGCVLFGAGSDLLKDKKFEQYRVRSGSLRIIYKESMEHYATESAGSEFRCGPHIKTIGDLMKVFGEQKTEDGKQRIDYRFIQ